MATLGSGSVIRNPLAPCQPATPPHHILADEPMYSSGMQLPGYSSPIMPVGFISETKAIFLIPS